VVNYRNAFLWTGLLGACAASLHATPQLSLASTSLAQVTVAAGANGPTQSVDAENIGTGSLNLQVTASAAWISATLGILTLAPVEREPACPFKSPSTHPPWQRVRTPAK
jgi:hypothetical protein